MAGSLGSRWKRRVRKALRSLRAGQGRSSDSAPIAENNAAVPEPKPPGRTPPDDDARRGGRRLSIRQSAPHLFPDRKSLQEKANPQTQALFFSVLPPEIRRLIYSFMWRTGGHTNGVHVEVNDMPRPLDPLRLTNLSSYPCVLDHDEVFKDAAMNREIEALWKRYDKEGKLETNRRGRLGIDVPWEKLKTKRRRLHDYCQERPMAKADGKRFQRHEWSPFLPVLLTCKKIYLESINTIFETLPFYFASDGDLAAHRFLAVEPHPSLPYLRELHLFGQLPPRNEFIAVARPFVECMWAAIRELPGLKEVVVTQNDERAAGQVDLRRVARMAGRELAGKMTVQVPEEEWAECEKCLTKRTILLPGEDGGHEGDTDGEAQGEREEMGGETPRFGKVRRYEVLKFFAEEDYWPQVKHLILRDATGMCWRCVQFSRFDGTAIHP